MNENARQQESAKLMMRFAERTGLIPGREEVRYLWTDAFAVCNFLELGRAMGDSRYGDLALRLVDRVHQVLGKHRPDDPRPGWISGLDDAQAELHPTGGGLRIGKPLAERAPEAAFDEGLEWERDGQYFHYLSKWMHALDQVSRSTQDPLYNLWSRELAQVAYRAFTREGPAGQPLRMAWKMSIDLSRPLVPSMGQHDPLDGFITCVELQSTATGFAQGGEPGRFTEERGSAIDLSKATRGFAAMAESGAWITADALGVGGLLADACRVAQLMPNELFGGDDWLRALLTSALAGLTRYASRGELQQAASRRLAFRELGLGIGLHGLSIIRELLSTQAERFAAPAAIGALLDELGPFTRLVRSIESFWMQPAHQQSGSWNSHLDINEVMLATCLIPDGFLRL